MLERRLRRIGSGALLALAGLACNGGGTGPERPALGGTWSYRFTLSGAAIACESTAARLQLDQVVAGGTAQFDQRFSGSLASFDLTCRRLDRTPVRSGVLRFGPANVVDGVLRDRELAFDVETPDLLHTGVLEEDRMAGTIAARLDLSTLPLDVGAVNLTGEWEATR